MAFFGAVAEGFLGHRLMQALASVPAAQALHFGSYALIVEPTVATQRALVEREWQRSVIAYDSNIRLNVEPGIQRWRDTLQWMLPRTALLKVIDEDLGLLHPGRSARAWTATSLTPCRASRRRPRPSPARAVAPTCRGARSCPRLRHGCQPSRRDYC